MIRSEPSDSERTLRAAAFEGGAEEPVSALFTDLDQELRQLAGAVFAEQHASHTLQPTALVNEVWLKIASVKTVQDRVHFLALAAKAMRQILTDHARAKRREKRGGGALQLEFREAIGTGGGSDRGQRLEIDLLDFEDALCRLSNLNERHARVAEYRLLGSLSVPEIASLLDVNERTVKRDWSTARLWLLRELFPQ